MNGLERVGIDTAIRKIQEIYPRLEAKNEGRMDHERGFILKEIEELHGILHALAENDNLLKNPKH